MYMVWGSACGGVAEQLLFLFFGFLVFWRSRRSLSARTSAFLGAATALPRGRGPTCSTRSIRPRRGPADQYASNRYAPDSRCTSHRSGPTNQSCRTSRACTERHHKRSSSLSWSIDSVEHRSASVKVPGSHFFGFEAPSSSTTHPRRAGLHLDCFLASAYVPSAHGMHSSAPLLGA